MEGCSPQKHKKYIVKIWQILKILQILKFVNFQYGK